jgi:DNA-binding NtrC family response regulator
MQRPVELISKYAGRDHLEERSRLNMRLGDLPPVSKVLIVDDTVFDADVLSSTLRLVFGHDIQITHVKHLRDVRKAVVDLMPDLLFLDDRLGHGTSAEVSLKIIQATDWQRKVIVMSGLLTRARNIELMKLGAGDVVHKDDINASRIAEAALKVLGAPRPS